MKSGRESKRRWTRRKSLQLIGAMTALAVAAGLVLALSSFGDDDRPSGVAASGGSVTRGAAATSGPAVASASAAAEPPPALGARRSAARVSVAVDTNDPRAPVPDRFLGLSFELSALRQVARYSEYGDLIALLRSLGPGVLRFGGISADTRVAWSDPQTPKPAWASSVIEAPDLQRLGRLAQRSGWPVILTIGLAHYDTEAAAREAAAAKSALGRNLVGIELGNEPDAYLKHGLRSTPWTFSQYAGQVTAYRRAIARVAAGIPLVGPDVSGSSVFQTWGPAEATRERPLLLTGHHYPLGCRDVPPPSIARLLSPRVRRMEAVSLRRYASVSRSRAIGFRLDETNTVSCGGRSGISDTFASALWAVDYVARTMSAGLAGINFQAAPANCYGYSAVCATSAEGLSRGLLRPQPEWYALLLARALVGARPLPSVVRAARPRNVDAKSFLAPDGSLICVIVDDDPPAAGPIAVSLHAGRRFASASIVALTAASPAARSGVELGGRAVAANGSWSESGGPSRRVDRHGTLTLTVAPSSAIRVTLAPAAGARTTR